MTMGKLIRTLTAATLLLSAACTTSQQTTPPLSGPSEFAQSLRVTATPDSISKDGASQSAIAVNAFDINGKGIPGLALRIDMAVSGSVVDYGTLSARTIVTNSNGQASTVYTAPPPSPLDGGYGNVVTIVATPTSTNFDTVTPQLATIRLVPTGVILAPAGSPTAAFTTSPSTVTVNVPIVFDGSTSKPGTGASTITSYSWNFGDGTSGTGKTVSHAFRSDDTFTVTLTVTNDRGLSASTSSPVSPAASKLAADFTVSPAAAVPNQPSTFDASTSVVPLGARIMDYSWSFGDGPQVFHSSSPIIQHTYAVSSTSTYTTTLTITDNFGNTAVKTKDVSVTGVGQPALAAFTITPSPATVGQVVTFDSYLSRVGAGGGRIVNEQWDFGDGTGILGVGGPDGGTVVTHTYAKSGTFTITLTITTDFGNTGSVSHTLLVQ